jgi:hypothetical protein
MLIRFGGRREKGIQRLPFLGRLGITQRASLCGVAMAIVLPHL